MVFRLFVLCCTVLGWAKELPPPSGIYGINYMFKQCYGELGCFSTGGDFAERLLNVLPASRQSINTKFLLYTRRASNQHHFLKAGDTKSLNQSYFSASRPTKFIVHGFLEHGSMPWIKDLMKALILKDDFNVIAVDWEGGSLRSYSQATANTRLVGAEIALLIKFLEKEVGAKEEDFHIIGHSLGSHVAGYAGERLQGLGRITGLDPADPFFQDMPPSVRLDPTDATFVDVIHTDAAHFANMVVLNGGMGLAQPVGHADFYPNGGNTQPGCNQSIIRHVIGQGVVNGARGFLGCNHIRAIDFFMESINSRCPFKAYPCSSYGDFKNGACMGCGWSGCSIMGYSADRSKPPEGKTNVKYYLQTGAESPFCHYHYRIKVTLGSPSGASSQKGIFKVQLFGTLGTTDEFSISEDGLHMEPGRSYWKLVTQSWDAGDLQKVMVRWECDSDLLVPWSWCTIRTAKLYLREVQVVSGERRKSYQFSAYNTELESDVKRAFDVGLIRDEKSVG